MERYYLTDAGNNVQRAEMPQELVTVIGIALSCILYLFFDKFVQFRHQHVTLRIIPQIQDKLDAIYMYYLATGFIEDAKRMEEYIDIKNALRQNLFNIDVSENMMIYIAENHTDYLQEIIDEDYLSKPKIIYRFLLHPVYETLIEIYGPDAFNIKAYFL